MKRNLFAELSEGLDAVEQHLASTKKKKFEKVCTLEGSFPELPSGRMYNTGRGTGGTLKAAFAAAGRDLFKNKNLRGRRLTSFKLIVSVGTREVVEEK